jgi:hypothetical protein
MNTFILLAQPWYINLLILVPVIVFFYFRKNKLSISKSQLFSVGIFGIAFGFVEAAVVFYLRAALGMLPAYQGTLSDVIQAGSTYVPIQAVNNLPQSLLTVEFFREVATIIMLIAIAFAAAKAFKERFALFLWAFAFWDLFYYVWLWALTRWPSSLTTSDVLFLIPVPWISQVWFPCLICILTMCAVLVNNEG